MATLRAKLVSSNIIKKNEADHLDDRKICNVACRRICKKIKTAVSAGEKQKLGAVLGLVKSHRHKLKRGMGIGNRKETASMRVRWEDSVSAFKSRIRTGVITNLKHKDAKRFLEDCEALFRRRINNTFKKYEAVKVNVNFCGEFQILSASKIQTEHKYFTRPNAPILKNTNIKEWFIKNVIELIMRELEEFQERDSGWALVNVVNLGVNINQYTAQLGSSFIKLPPQIERKQACINVKNNDDACFAWAVMSALHPVEKDPQRVSKYPHYSNVLKLKGIRFPMTMKQTDTQL